MFLTALQVTPIRLTVQHTKSYGFVTLHKTKKDDALSTVFLDSNLQKLESVSNTEQDFVVAGS